MTRWLVFIGAVAAAPTAAWAQAGPASSDEIIVTAPIEGQRTLGAADVLDRAALVETLNAATGAVVGEQETSQRLRMLGLDPAPGTPAELAQRLAKDDALWGPVIRRAGLRAG